MNDTNLEDIKLNDYIEGYEDVGTISKPRIKKIKGWVDDILRNSKGNIYGFDIQADDNWHGARGTTILCETGSIILSKSDLARPNYAEIQARR